jgi:hypothetical protein
VQRTLVKSPPELWAELSDPALLARHLGELGEIRITRVDPEQTVEWEAENTSGTVHIKPSGWGTRVTLTVTREIPESDRAAEAGALPTSEPTPQPEAEPTAQPEAEPTAQSEVEPTAQPEVEPMAQSEVEPTPRPEVESNLQSDAQPRAQAGGASAGRAEPEPAGEVESDPAWPEPLGGATLQAHPGFSLLDEEPERRLGFFARLFGRGRGPRTVEPESSGPTDLASEPAGQIPTGEPERQAPDSWEDLEAVEAPQTDASLKPPSESCEADASCGPALQPTSMEGWPASGEMARTDEPEHGQREALQAADISSELKAAEESATAEVTAVLTSVLDRLGAAHHRPFSRS